MEKGAEPRVKEPQKNRPIRSPLTRNATHDVADAADVNRRIVFSAFVGRRRIAGTSFRATEVLAFFFVFFFFVSSLQELRDTPVVYKNRRECDQRRPKSC